MDGSPTHQQHTGASRPCLSFFTAKNDSNNADALNALSDEDIQRIIEQTQQAQGTE